MNDVLDRYAFRSADQQFFSELSGDFNPLHLDPVAARRAFFGAVAVHGIHSLLRALDKLAADLDGPEGARLALTRLRGSFPNPTFLDTPTVCEYSPSGDNGARITAHCAGSLSLQAEIEWEWVYEPFPDDPPEQPPSPSPRTPSERQLDELKGLAGELPLWLEQRGAERFPGIGHQISKQTLAELLALTRLVGMECPGLRSIFTGFDLHFDPKGLASTNLHWKVNRVLAKASFIKLDVSTGTLSGTLDTFLRPAPQDQASYDEARSQVDAGSSEGQVAVVVGGSRGLGEVTAKLIAAGGGQVLVTYQRGQADAERVAQEIRSGGGRCEALPCDIAQPDAFARLLETSGLKPSHLYYFASPKIFAKRGGGYRPELFEEFKQAYVDGFEAICRACLAAASGPLRVFYPSSAAVDEKVKNLEEYADAKRAGEALCEKLEAENAQLQIVLRRLPRIATDQTTTLQYFPSADGLQTMCEPVREMNGINHG